MATNVAVIKEKGMFAITGVTGQVGGKVARNLLANEKQIRAVVRNADKAKHWEKPESQIFIADMNDATALTKAFTGTEGVFIMLPPTFDPSEGFTEARQTIEAIREALARANPPKVVCLSTIGADSNNPNLLNQLGMLEHELSVLNMPIAFLRAAWFMENSNWDIASALEKGVIFSFLQPLDKPFPMIATADVGQTAAELLQEDWQGIRIINLETEVRISPNDIAAAFSKTLGKTVNAESVPQDIWFDLFTSQGMKNPLPRIQMLNGFNQGWIAFSPHETESRKGKVKMEHVLEKLISNATK